jgi:hypothetical protein
MCSRKRTNTQKSTAGKSILTLLLLFFFFLLF